MRATEFWLESEHPGVVDELNTLARTPGDERILVQLGAGNHRAAGSGAVYESAHCTWKTLNIAVSKWCFGIEKREDVLRDPRFAFTNLGQAKNFIPRIYPGLNFLSGGAGCEEELNEILESGLPEDQIIVGAYFTWSLSEHAFALNPSLQKIVSNEVECSYTTNDPFKESGVRKVLEFHSFNWARSLRVQAMTPENKNKNKRKAPADLEQIWTEYMHAKKIKREYKHRENLRKLAKRKIVSIGA